jgi:hypothetical protein
VPIPAPHPSGFGDPGFDYAERERLERLAEAEEHLAQVLQHSTEGEDRREDHFRQNEDARDRAFQERQSRREQEAVQRLEDLLQGLQQRLADAIPPHVPPTGPVMPHTDGQLPPPDVGPSHADDISAGDAASIITSIRTVASDVAARRADILEIVNGMREDNAREREQLQASIDRTLEQAEADRRAHNEEREARIRALEEELERVKTDLQNEREQRETEEADRKERERAEALERDEVVRNQLADITNLLQDQREDCARKRETSDDRWAEQQARNERKDAQCQEVHDMVTKLLEDREAERIRAEDERLAAEGRPGKLATHHPSRISLKVYAPGLERVLEELAKQNSELRELLNSLSDSMACRLPLLSLAHLCRQPGEPIAVGSTRRPLMLSEQPHRSRCRSTLRR